MMSTNYVMVRGAAEKNEEPLLKTIDTDEGSRYLVEFAIGTKMHNHFTLHDHLLLLYWLWS